MLNDNKKGKLAFYEKYKANVDGISKANNVDVGIATDMLIFILKQLSDQGPDFYPGCGKIDIDAAIKDYKALEGSWIAGQE